MSATFNRKTIMANAHFTARWRVPTVGGSYREWFAKGLAHEWKKAREAKVRRDRIALNDRLNFELNTGLPIRSCPADAVRQAQAKAFLSVRPARRLFTNHSGRLAGSFAA